MTGAELRDEPKVIHSSEGDFAGRTIILATGAYPRELGIPGEQDLRGRGVAYCATCDGEFFTGKITAGSLTFLLTGNRWQII